MKFRKIPVVIEAMQVYPAYIEMLDKFITCEHSLFEHSGKIGVRVKTLEGWYDYPEGYWIIKGVKGEFYGCDPDIFQKTYEVAE